MHPIAGGAEVRLYEVIRRLVKWARLLVSKKPMGLFGMKVIEGLGSDASAGTIGRRVLGPVYGGGS